MSLVISLNEGQRDQTPVENQAAGILRNKNNIKTGTIFIERPYKVFVLACKDSSVSLFEKCLRFARVVQMVFFSIFTWDSSLLVGHLIKKHLQEGRIEIYSVHTSFLYPRKWKVPDYFLYGCDWLIPDDQKMREKLSELNKAGLKKIPQSPIDLYKKIQKLSEKAVAPLAQCRSSFFGMLWMPFFRKKGIRDLCKGADYHPETAQSYTSTELIAKIWKTVGIDIANSRLRLDKIYPSDIIDEAESSRLWIYHKA